MAVNSVQDPKDAGQWENADLPDLSRYLNMLKRRWLEILLITLSTIVLAVAGVLIMRAFSAPVYESIATAAIVRVSTDVRFDERFATSAEQPNVDPNARRTALIAQVRSGSIAQQVIDEIGDQLPPKLRDSSELLDVVNGVMATANGRPGQSDLINITARAASPTVAALIANTWAKIYVEQINSVYGQVPDEMLQSVEKQLSKAQQNYAQVQGRLENQISASKLDAYTRQSDVISRTLETLQTSRINALNAYMDSLVDSYGTIVRTYLNSQADNQTLAFTKEQEGLRARLAAYLDAYNAAQVDTFAEQNNRYRTELRMYYDQWLRTSNLLTAARTLQQQLVSSTASPTSALALQVLKLQMVNAAAVAPPSPSTTYLEPGEPQQGALPNAPVQQPKLDQAAQAAVAGQTPPMQIQLGATGAIDATALRTEVDATVTSLQNQLTDLETKIADLNQALLSGDGFQHLDAAVSSDSPLAAAITKAYPSLFQTGVFTASQLAGDSTLFAAAQAQAALFLSQAETSTLPTGNTQDAPLATPIAELEEQLRTVQGQIEAESARIEEFTQARDLAWQSVEALSNKQAELTLARAAANSEVRLSSAAVPLDEPVVTVRLSNTILLFTVVGLLLGLIAAFVLETLNVRPLRAPEPAAAGV